MQDYLPFCIALLLMTAAPALFAQQGGEADEAQLTQLREARKALAEQPRPLIVNNDGCDALHYPEGREQTVEAFLELRTSPMVGSQASTVFYCPISAGFSYVTYNTKVGSILTDSPPGRVNLTGELLRQGTDPLRVVTDFCHANDIETFCSFRMNDTHDGAHRPDNPYLLFPPLKYEHPEWLIGSLEKRPRHGSWTSVNYAIPEVRDIQFRLCEEVCQNYDVEGIELDFFRHLSYFPTPAYGGRATQEELDMMTDLLRRIRRMTEIEGIKRGRPILVATRIPDSVEFAKALGLDLERWMQEGLVDIVVGSGYFQFNPWEYIVELGHKYDIQVYAGLSESRVQGDVAPLKRNAIESYRARAARAWQAGVDGIYTFNYFNPKGQMLWEIGDPKTLAGLDKVYFTTVRADTPGRYLTGGDEMRNVPIITPQNPIPWATGNDLKTVVLVGDDLSAPEAADMELGLWVLGSGVTSARALLNEVELGEPERQGSWLVFPVPANAVKQGQNDIVLQRLDPEPTADDDDWSVTWEAADGAPGAPWRLDRATENCVRKIEDGAMLLADRSDDSGTYMYVHYAWGIDSQKETVAEARVKVVSGWNNIIVYNGVAGERVGLYPDRVEMYSSHDVYKMDTTDDFHTYRVVLKGKDFKIYVDGELAIDGTGKFTATSPGGRNEISLGAANSPERGEALWQSVKLKLASGSLLDVALSVKKPAAE